MKYLILLVSLNSFAQCILQPCIIIKNNQNEEKFYQLREKNINIKSKMLEVESNKLIEYAKTFIGAPYLYGGEDKDGIDCSAYVKQIFSHFGYYLPRTSRQQFADDRLSIVKINELKPLDFIFFKSLQTGEINHVALYIGDGKIIHSSRRGNGVSVTDIKFSSFWSKRFYAAKRANHNLN